ncbi:hypothetical protein [Roseibium suaedae]|uniref:Uncharacterized protein n=1 Tax=Roseibium suaedae TaxID=735517 RepID=A0A1M7L4M7_9HYPH|nr:hypothetical protein [Roseibium suaedae]SHM73057.1 hypothetical protein SAMN05444272_3075 [Roseibium suaedae]
MPKRTEVDDDISNKVHGATLELMLGIGSYFAQGDKKINEIIFVPMAITARIARLHEAIATLLKDGYISEAAILSLTVFELRIDLLDVASDIKRATAWIEHDNPKRKLEGMKPSLVRLFSAARANRMYEIFRTLSGIKHGNPLFSDLAFPVTKRQNRMTVTTGPIENASTKAFSRAVFAYSTYQLIWSAQVLNKLVAQYTVIDRHTRQNVHDLYMSLRKVETEFYTHCRRKVASKETFFNLKKRDRSKSNAPKDTDPTIVS